MDRMMLPIPAYEKREFGCDCTYSADAASGSSYQNGVRVCLSGVSRSLGGKGIDLGKVPVISYG